MIDATVSVIAIGGRGWAEAQADLTPEDRTTALGLRKAWWKDVTFYHRDGYRYEAASAVPVEPLGPLAHLFTRIGYNPWLQVRYEYRRQAAYQVNELKVALGVAIRADDDILTQFHEAEELLAQLESASTFSEVADVLRLAGTDTAAA